MVFRTSTTGGALVITFEAVAFKETGGADSLGATVEVELELRSSKLEWKWSLFNAVLWLVLVKWLNS